MTRAASGRRARIAAGGHAAAFSRLLRLLPLLVPLLALLLAPVAVAKPKTPAPPGQGRVCNAQLTCSAGLSCIAHSDGKSTCEIVCSSSDKCPEDQRCVRDGKQSVCHGTIDLDL